MGTKEIKPIRIGTRVSELAMTQTHLVMAALKEKVPEVLFEVVPLQTLGDKILDKPLLSFGGKGVFVSEFEEGLLSGTIDLAVHSAKDMPMALPEGLDIVGVPKREDPRDVLITMKGTTLREEAIIGTSSLRRQYQIKALKKVVCKDLRGNVNTRLRKLEEGQYDGIILAAAGLKRLGLHEETKYTYQYFDCESFVPAGGQGIIAVEGRKDDPISKLISEINDEESVISLNIERDVLQGLNAGCHEPIGVYSFIKEGQFYLTLLKGEEGHIEKVQGAIPINQAKQLASHLVQELKAKCFPQEQKKS